MFLRLGMIAFGGPVAHMALMREELVRRRGWVSDQRFVDLMGATNLIPGPNSTELALHLGWDRARWRGLVAAGVCFILPAALIVTALAWGYVEYGTAPFVEDLFYGVVPVVVAIIVVALAGLLRTVVWERPSARARAGLALVAAAALAAYLWGVNELVVLAAGAVVPAVARLGVLGRGRRGAAAMVLPLLALGDSDPDRLGPLFLTMLKIGSVLFGGGYVLLAFLEGDFVDRLGWVTHQQLIDAVSIGQVTPGPLFTTATFLGYLVAGLPGAFVATVGIFLPSFVFVGLLTRLTDRLRASPWTAVMLDGLNAAALALMAGVTWRLGREAVVDVWAAMICLATLALLRWTGFNSAWFIAAGAAAGLLIGLL